jgi:glycine oxidase
MQTGTIIVAGAGITGLWQALTLARRGHRVRLVERSAEPFTDSASAYAGAMLGPFCEKEVYAPVVRDLGLKSIGLWRETYPGTVVEGTLVVASARDRSEVDHFARLTEGHARIDGDTIVRLEPDLAGRFSAGLFYAREAHVAPRAAMEFLLEEARRAGVDVAFGTDWHDAAASSETVIDCRGLGARATLSNLRGVRGERLVVRTREIGFRRPVRFLHPRQSIYVVPWGEGLHMVGATVIESDDMGPITVRSALELLGMAYALHPAFGEAQIVDAGAGVRPAFADNVPKVIVRGQTIHVNGLYRHGFLLAPALAELVAEYLANGAIDNRVFVTEPQP